MTSESGWQQAAHGAGGHEGDTALFFAELFAGAPEPLAAERALIWRLPDKQSRFVRSEIEAVTAVDLLRPSCDVYVGVGSRTRDLGSQIRGGAEEIASLYGLWADIDFQHPAHASSKPYPPDTEAALGLLSAMPLQPSVTVHTGHGIHAWWLFEEWYAIETAAERARVQETARGWQAVMGDKAAARGWVVDAVHDIARVLRVPGTWNRKIASDPKPVRLLSVEGPRYAGPADFEEWAAMAAGGRRPGGAVPLALHGMLLHLDPRATPPFERFEALRENDRTFGRTWERRRPDLGDQSASAYDMALASMAARAGWDPQEIANLLIASRRKHGDDLKLREDYYARTIARARQTTEQRAAISRILTSGTEQGSAGSTGAGSETPPRPESGDTATPDREALRTRAREAVAQALGLPVARWLQHNSENSRYTLVLTDGREVALGSVEAVTSITRFNNAVFQALGCAIPLLKRHEWWSVVTMLGQIVELVETIDATRRGTLRDWLRSYLADTREEGRGEPWKIVEQQLPFYEGGEIWVHARSLRQHVVRVAGEQVEMADLTDMLREAGFTRRQRSARVPDDRRNGRPAVVNVSYWHAPREVLDETPAGGDVSA